jgi:hypothetical protein
VSLDDEAFESRTTLCLSATMCRFPALVYFSFGDEGVCELIAEQ